MKKLLMTIFIGVAITSAANAQQAKVDPDELRIENEKQIRDELKLTHQQTPVYFSLNKEYHNKIAAVQKDQALSISARREKENALKKEKEAKMLELLNPEQEVRYKEIADRGKDKSTS
jgi:hypothetical protein